MSVIELDQNAIFNSINIGLLVIDVDGNILLWNDWIATYSGIDTATALQKKIDTVFSKPPSTAFLSAVKNTIQYGLPVVLSNALHRSPLPLFIVDEGSEIPTPIHQAITITALNIDKETRCCLVQIVDSSTSIKRERMLRSHSELLKKDATTDSLTGIYNRRFFDEYYKISLGQAIRQKQPLSIFMVDIDFFKQYNDYYGHPAGDKVLISVAATLKAQISRSSDMLARYGGEEFILILPNMTEENGLLFAEKLITSITDLVLPHAKSKVCNFVSVSIGLSTYDPARHREVSALVDAADTALYKAKQQGRNRAVFFGLDNLIGSRPL
jgi:diguanylate cyclase (GGDEF)-like protein